jgi:hypothetical protein
MLFNLSPDPFTLASEATQVPVQLLVAISRVESSDHPWALNIEGKSIYAKDRQETEHFLKHASDDVDIGLMQVNYRIWGQHLGLTKDDLLDPYTNAWAGAVILRFYLSQYPFWEAIGRYHSTNRTRQIEYAWRVYQALLPNSK